MISRRAVITALTLLIATLIPAAPAAAESRIRTGEVDGMKFTVLLPTGYDRSKRPYPVLYLVHPGGNTGADWLERSDLVEFTADEDVIVVLPDAPELGILVDARDGSCRGETKVMRSLIPHVDRHFRTVADGAHRAIAGASTSAFSAMHIAARNPGSFAAAGSFDGPPDSTFGMGRPGTLFFFTIVDRYGVVTDCGGSPIGPGLFGDPVRDELWWHDANPADLAANLHGLGLYVGVGNGQPCDQRDVLGLTESQQNGTPGSQLLQLSGPYEATSSRAFVAALQRARVPHVADVDRCGLHSWRYWQHELHEFWPVMTRSWGRPTPGGFEHRRAAPRFGAWGWTFAADPARAPEFLTVRSASRHGLTFIGSGRTIVTTAAYFTPRQRVQVDDCIVRAGRDGRLTFTVHLGPPHTVQQHRDENRLAESSPGYFTTRHVTLTPAR